MSETIEPPIPLPPAPVQAGSLPQATAGAVIAPSIAILGGLLAVVGSFMPWMTVTAPMYGTVSKSGTDQGGDGNIILVLGIIAIALAAAFYGRWTSNGKCVGGWICASINLIIGGFVLADAIVSIDQVEQRIQTATGSYSGYNNYIIGNVGTGLYMLVIAGVLIAGASIAAGAEGMAKAAKR